MEIKKKRLLEITLGGFALTAIGLFADINSLVTSEWFKKILSSDVIKYAPYALNIALCCFLLYLYIKEKNAEKSFEQNEEINDELWEKLTRSIRGIALSCITPYPSSNDSINPCLEALERRLPNKGGTHKYKMAVAVPHTDGSFKIVAHIGMDSDSVHSIGEDANWKNKKTLFSHGLTFPENEPYDKYPSGKGSYEDIESPYRVNPSIAHFIISIKYSKYSEQVFPRNTLGVLSIGIPKDCDFEDSEKQAFYQNAFPMIKSIETILLKRMIVDKDQKLRI